MTTNPRSREAAYADLVSGLIDARIDVASERFDTELESAEASGRLDPATARLIRWWQRESVRAVTEHARTTIPVSLVALEKAANESREAVNRADAAWTTARGVSARATYASDDEIASPAPRATGTPATGAAAPTAEPAPDETATPTPTTSPAAASPPPAAETPEPPAAAPRTLEPPGYPGDQPIAAPPAFVAPPAPPAPPVSPAPPAPPAPPVAAYPPAPGEAPAIVDLTTPRGEGEERDQDATPAGGRRRTLLAGLTVLPRSD